MRSFRHLTRTEITEIIHLKLEGVGNNDLAERYGCDPSTISYHFKQYKKAYPEEGGIYALIKIEVRRKCIHPSSVCTLCGMMRDELSRKEREIIESLGRRLNDAHSTLRSVGFDVESMPYTGLYETTP